MTALSDRSLWLAHLKHCTQCPVNRCDRGDELAAAVRELLAPGEHWEGIYRPPDWLPGQMELSLEAP